MTILGKEIPVPELRLPADLGSIVAVTVFLAYLGTAFFS